MSVNEAVIAALENPRYDWRTVDGISKETGITPPEIRRALADAKDIVIQSSIPDDRGRALYTTRRHYRKTHGLGLRILSALADKVA